MRQWFGIVASGACALSMVACASSKPATAEPAGPAAQPVAEAPAAAPTPVLSGTVGEQAVTVVATVQKIDLKTRHVTLKGPDGKVTTMKVGAEARNLPQVKKGDLVKVTYYESLAYDVVKPGQAMPGVAVAEGGTRAELGQKPGSALAKTTTITATLTGFDKAAQTATLLGPDGKSVTFKVKNPANLEKVAVGDLVQLTYTEAVAIAVEKPETAQ